VVSVDRPRRSRAATLTNLGFSGLSPERLHVLRAYTNNRNRTIERKPLTPACYGACFRLRARRRRSVLRGSAPMQLDRIEEQRRCGGRNDSIRRDRRRTLVPRARAVREGPRIEGRVTPLRRRNASVPTTPLKMTPPARSATANDAPAAESPSDSEPRSERERLEQKVESACGDASVSWGAPQVLKPRAMGSFVNERETAAVRPVVLMPMRGRAAKCSSWAMPSHVASGSRGCGTCCRRCARGSSPVNTSTSQHAQISCVRERPQTVPFFWA